MRLLHHRITRVGLAAALFAVLAAWLPVAQGAPPQPVSNIVAPHITDYVLAKIPGRAPTTQGGPATVDGPAFLGGHRIVHVFGDWYKLYPTATTESVDSQLATAAGLPGVVAVGPDYIVTAHAAMPPSAMPPSAAPASAAPASAAPNDPLYPRQWHMPQVQVEQAWEATTGLDAASGEGVIIAILDTGVRDGGPDGFCGGLFAEYNVFNDSSAPGAAADTVNHGTHVAGTAAGCADNGLGVVGVAPDARLMAVKVLGDNGEGSYADVVEGITWAADHGAQVINMSLGAPCQTTWPTCSEDIVNEAIDYAASLDVVIVASAGNNSMPNLGKPGNHPQVIGVGATRYDQARAYYSNYGPAMDLSAPGGHTGLDQNGDGYADGVLQETFSHTNPNSWDYYNFQGTSMAAPHVAGAAALLRACVPEADRDEVRNALEGQALDLGTPGYDTIYGHGFLQIYDSLVALAQAHGRDPLNGCALSGEPPPCFSVSVTADGPGLVTVSPPPNCDPDGEEPTENTHYTFGTLLTLVATPDVDNQFDGWGGDLRGDLSPITVRATRDRVISGAFSAPSLEPQLLLSHKANGTIGSLTYADEDVLLFDPFVGLSLWLDGSPYGLGKKDIDAVALAPDGTILLSLDAPVRNLPGIGKVAVDDSDIVRFNPTTKLFSWYFDGSDVGLATAAEDVDAIALLPDGRLLISTAGAAKTPWLNAGGEDILVYDGPLDTNVTMGTLALYFDGSALAPKLKKIGGVAFSPGGPLGLGYLYLTTDKNAMIGGLSVTKGDVFRCEIESLGAASACETLELFWRSVDYGFPAKAALDAVEVVFP